MVAKNWRFFERFRLQFRWEVFNFTNTPQLELPNQTTGAYDSGRSDVAERAEEILSQAAINRKWT